MSDIFSRNKLIWGENNQKLLAQKHVAVFGLGGVGGYAAESLARAGVGKLSLIDFDAVSESNLNRQIIALHSTVGKSKTELFESRLKDINPDIKINSFNSFYTENINHCVFNDKIDFVIDAIDTLKSKIQLLEYCHSNNIKVISSMGAGNRLDPTKLKIKDLSELCDIKCPFIKNVKRILNKKNITTGIICVTSDEKPKKGSHIKSQENIKTENGTIELLKVSPGSVIFVPAVAGYYMGYYVTNCFIMQV
ncbi:MAG: tRNA threonylcarbamoyladenosine dehydratase [Candidatus Gastranaerophilales bacterium]|nr:tRNA threonylcarbamoyladenosine dehydratase [Candidatus Gastranaerophilales bacterium]